jgi:hypothetical protein
MPDPITYTTYFQSAYEALKNGEREKTERVVCQTSPFEGYIYTNPKQLIYLQPEDYKVE